MKQSRQFLPYANEADVRHIGQLCIENRLDRITISGDLDLTADQRGLADARALQQLLNDVVAALESHTLPATLAPAVVTTVANPFGDSA
ncbi:hypothetical protein GTP23_12290 [Pseudoduganella sp. FT93W]|uniref:Uncharacterized protein n=1 Tax=Duganella fentianensis TaxID=2692177 RepID=A0A845I174_9BURK|nr:hypothetical protein [Duganella fentianensis]MYN45827.1 hypothetical protein [Duganella fentianensis]